MIRRVFVGGEGVMRGGMEDRSIERFEREERFEDGFEDGLEEVGS